MLIESEFPCHLEGKYKNVEASRELIKLERTPTSLVLPNTFRSSAVLASNFALRSTPAKRNNVVRAALAYVKHLWHPATESPDSSHAHLSNPC